MSLIARPFRPEDADAYFEIMSATYGSGVPVSAEDRKLPTTRTCVAEIGGAVAGVAKMNDYVCTRGAAELRSAGIAAVAVSPAHRRSGVGAALVSWAVRFAREEGFEVSSLYPFRAPYYRKFGYETVGKRLTIHSPAPRLPKPKSDLCVRKLVPTDWQLIRTCYEGFARARSGFHIRDEKRWNDVLTARDHPVAYGFGDPLEAYAIVAHKADFWETQKVAEVAWTTEAGHRAILAWFSGLVENKTAVEWSEPSDSPYVARFNDQGVDIKLAQPIMMRAVNVEAAIRRLRPSASGELTFEVLDELIPENRGPWRASFSENRVEIDKCGQADLTFDSGSFACALMGEPSVLDLARNGLVQVRESAAVSAAARLLPPLPVSCWDFF